MPDATTSLTYRIREERGEGRSARDFEQEFVRRFVIALKPLVAPRRLLFLQGALGTGKTEIARLLIQELTDEGIFVPSPTFAILQPYATTRGAVLHTDLYRLTSEQTLDLGLEEALDKGFVMIEWAERLHPALKARLLEQADLLQLRLAYDTDGDKTNDDPPLERTAVLTLPQRLATKALRDLPSQARQVRSKASSRTKPPAITRAFVLAAGLGTRLRVHTQKPKPLVEVGGKPLLLHAIERLQTQGVEQIFVNAHYRADAILKACKGLRGVVVLQEHTLLETGGGIARALPLLEDQPFFALNADALWYDPPHLVSSSLEAPSLLACLEEHWQSLVEKEKKKEEKQKTTALLALIEQQGAKDMLARDAATLEVDKPFPLIFPVNPCEHAEDTLSNKQPNKYPNKYLGFRYIGVQILTARAFRAFRSHPATPPTPYSLTEIYARESAASRLFGVTVEKRWRGRWLHVGDPAGLMNARRVWRRLGQQA